MVVKFQHHFVSIASATLNAGGRTGIMGREDGFFYDVLQLPDGQAQRLKVRSMVGLLPLCAVSVFEPEFPQRFPEIMKRLNGFLEARPSWFHSSTTPPSPGKGSPPRSDPG